MDDRSTWSSSQVLAVYAAVCQDVSSAHHTLTIPRKKKELLSDGRFVFSQVPRCDGDDGGENVYLLEVRDRIQLGIGVNSVLSVNNTTDRPSSGSTVPQRTPPLLPSSAMSILVPSDIPY